MSNGVPAPGKYWIWMNRIFCWILGYAVGNWYGCDKLSSAQFVQCSDCYCWKWSCSFHSISFPEFKEPKTGRRVYRFTAGTIRQNHPQIKATPSSNPQQRLEGIWFHIDHRIYQTIFSTSLHHWISSPKKDQNYFFINFKNRICHDLTQLAVTSLGACEKPRLYMLFIDPRCSMVLESLP